MATISVPLSPELQHQLDRLIADGIGSNRADVMRRALERLSEEEAINAILKAEREPTIKGDLRTLLTKID